MAETMQVDLERVVKDLQEKAARGELSPCELETTVQQVERLLGDMIRFLEHYARIVKPEEREKVRNLLARLAHFSHHTLFERVRRQAWRLRGHKELQESVKKQGYRIINLARAGRRDEVAYLLTRIFLAQGQALPDELIRVFSPSVPEDVFRACIYAFVGVMGEKKDETAEQGGEA